MRSPMGPRGLEVFHLTASKNIDKYVKGVLFWQGVNACINPNWQNWGHVLTLVAKSALTVQLQRQLLYDNYSYCTIPT